MEGRSEHLTRNQSKMIYIEVKIILVTEMIVRLSF